MYPQHNIVLMVLAKPLNYGGLKWVVGMLLGQTYEGMQILFHQNQI